MRQIQMVLAAVLVVALAALTPVRAEDKDNDKAGKLTGKWTVTEVNKDGKKQDDTKDKTVTVTGDTISCYGADKKCEMECTYKIDTSEKPNTITLKCTEGEHKGKTLMGIVRVDGDTATISFSKPDGKAPTSFDKTSDGQCTITLKRVAKE